MSPAVIQRGMLSAQAAFSRHSMGKPAFSIIPVPTPAQRSALYLQNLANLAAGETSPRFDQGGGKRRGLGRAPLGIAIDKLWRGFVFVNNYKAIAGVAGWLNLLLVNKHLISLGFSVFSVAPGY